MQNNAIDIYEEYFSNYKSTAISSDPPSAKTVSIFRDPNDVKRAVTHISWYPDGAARLAAAYSTLEFQKLGGTMCLDSYIWELGMLLAVISISGIIFNSHDSRESKQTRAHYASFISHAVFGVQPQRSSHVSWGLLQRPASCL